MRKRTKITWGGWLKIWLEKYRTPVYRDMAIYLAILLTCGFYHLEFPRISRVLTLIRAGLAATFGVTALWLGFCNGVYRRFSFPVFTSLATILPGILYWFTSSRVYDHGFGGFCTDLAELLFRLPFMDMRWVISKLAFSLPLGLVAFLPTLAAWAFFLLGWLISRQFPASSKETGLPVNPA